MALPLAFALTMDVSNFVAMGKMAEQAFFGLVSAVGNGIKELAERGSEIAGVENAFIRLAATAGQSGSDILKATRGASMGMISDFDAMAFANKGLLMGLPITDKDMATLAKTAITLGQAMKIGPAKAMEDLITGLGRGSPLILDNLGIVLNEVEAHKAFAASIGKSTEALSGQEKTIAVYNAAMAAAGKRVEEIGGIQMGATQIVEQLSTAWTNAYDEMARAVADSNLTPALAELGDALLDLAGSGTMKDLANDILIPIIDFTTTIVQGLTYLVDTVKMVVDEFKRLKAAADEFAGSKLVNVMLNELSPGLGMFKSGSSGMGGQKLSATSSARGAATWSEVWGSDEMTVGEQKKSAAEMDRMRKAAEAAQKKHVAEVARLAQEEASARKAGFDQMEREMGAFIRNYEENQRKLTEASMGRDVVNAQNKALKAEVSSAMDSIIAGVVVENVAADAAKSFGGNFVSGLKGAMAGLPQVILGAIQGGGDVGKAIGASIGGNIGQSLEGPLKSALSGVLGKTLGGALGSLAGPLGSMLGSKIGGLVSGLFGGGESKKVNDLRDQFISAAGGIDALRIKAAQAGMGLEQLLRVSKVKDFEAAVLQLNGAFGAQAAAGEAVNAAMQKYGLTVSEMGPKFAQQQMDEQVGQLIKDYEILRASGADMNAVTEKMGPAMNEYVQQAVAAGIAIPENMRGPLTKMLEMGLLTDAAGNKMESLEGLTWTETLTEGLSRAVDAIEDLVAGIGRLLGVGPIDIPVRVGGGGDYGGGRYDIPDGEGPRFAGGGIYRGPDNGPARLERGEGVFTPEQMAALGGGGSTTLVLDGRVLAKWVADGVKTGHIPVAVG